jgi:peroxiredoxin/mono/diheme cytochrome c family protein
LSGLTADDKESPALAFTLKDAAGKPVALADFKDKKAVAVVFLGTECPLVNLYALRLRELHEEFSPRGVQFLAVNANMQDSAEAVAAHAKKHHLPFPVLKDADLKVADQFAAQRTPEAFVLDGKRQIVYRGRIDDQFGIGYQRNQPTRRDLGEALKEVLAGKPVSVAKTDVQGCFIGRDKKEVATGDITYTKHVAKIFQDRCQECHRSGQIGPFALSNYRQAKAWSDTIKEVVTERRMPPWHADPRYGKFLNDKSLSKEERETILAWVDAGCPKGDDKDLPPARQFRGQDGWSIGKPDVIVTMTEDFKVPAKAPKNGVPYQFFLAPTNFTEDVWVRAAEAKPGSPSVVHHIIVYILEPGKRLDMKEDLIGTGLLVGEAPGDLPFQARPGMAKRIPKGANLLFQMHYTPNGVEQTDRSMCGLILAKEPPQHVVRTRSVMNRRFAIPPGADGYEVVSTSPFKKDAVVLGFMPHMHVRGKDFQYKLVYPDGKEEIVLNVPRYDFNWQTNYYPVEPIKMPAGTKMVCTAHYDNSTANLNNPDPTKTVYWGDQTWEEMMIGWIDYYFVDEKP